jgi:hypothetical protein
MEGEVIKLDKPDGAEDEKYYTVKREDGKTMKYAPNELKLAEKEGKEEEEKEEKEDVKEAKNCGASKKAETSFHKKLDSLVHHTFGKREEEKKMKEEVSYSAKKARAGEDIGKPGKMFSKISKEAGERYGSEERGKKVAGAVLAKLRKEEVDIFDVILEHLVAEGYADTNQAALVIMANMSEEWKQSIVEGMGLSVGASKLAGRLLSNPRTSSEEGAKNFQKNLADPVGYAVKGAARAVLGVGDEKNKQMMQKHRPN